MTGSDLYTLIYELSAISREMEGIKARDGFSLTELYPISGYKIEQIRNICNRACTMINSVDFVPNCPHQ